jgi:FkbM family methyltransferase
MSAKVLARDFDVRLEGYRFTSGYENIGGFYSICFMGAYDPILLSLTQDDVVLDGGANIGVFSVLAAKRASLVYAVEPNRRNFRYLLKNLYSNNVKNVIPINAALSNYEGRGFMAGEGETGYLSNHGQPVTVTTIDKIGRGTLTSMKLDIEGAETRAMAGLRSLDGIHSVCFELDGEHLDLLNSADGESRGNSRVAYSYAELMNRLRTAGFRLTDFNSSPTQIPEKIMSPDFLYDELQTRFFALRAFTSLILRTGKNLLSPRTLRDPRINTIYATRGINH